MKKKVAIIKYCGASAGGTEKYLQSIASNLNKEKFEVDYFYSGPAELLGSNFIHPEPNKKRLEYLENNGVNLIEFNVEKLDLRERAKTSWINSNFWDVFDETKYDLIQCAKSSQYEEPFDKIKNIPIFDSIHIPWGTYEQKNVEKIFMQSESIKKMWIDQGGNDEKIILGLNPIDEKQEYERNLRTELNLDNKFIFGMHQRKDDFIFSDVPLDCYSKIETSNTAFLIMGGSNRYTEQAQRLNLKNFHQFDFDFDDNSEEIFLNTLNVFAHGRKDGETFGLAIAEAMRNGLPIVSHKNTYNNGHIETIETGGKVVGSHRMYSLELVKLMKINSYYNKRRKNSLSLYDKKFSADKIIKKIENIYLNELL